MTKDTVAAVLAELARDEEFLFNLAQQLVRIPTVNPKFEPDPAINCEAELQRVLQAVLDDIGMVTESHDVFPGRPNLVGTLPGNDARSLILCGHVDVVPVGDRKMVRRSIRRRNPRPAFIWPWRNRHEIWRCR